MLAWDPDVIISRSDAFYAGIYDNADWAGITAVANKTVFNVPSMPFNRLDKPPCIARVIGTEWVLYKIYPEYVDFDITQEVIDFYRQFYQVDITAEQAEALIGMTFMLLADDVSRLALATETPLSLLAAVIGAPFFLYQLCRRRDARTTM